MIKKQLLGVLMLAGIIIVSCTKKEYVDVKPQLLVTVQDSIKNNISDATVYVYGSKQDYEEKGIYVATKKTNTLGTVLFENLEPIIYFIRAEKNPFSNKTGIVSFTDSLQMNTLSKITIIIK